MGKTYFYEIDGLRFYAFLFILLNHTNVSKSVEGHTFFFTLSGFLIGSSTLSFIRSGPAFSFKNYLIKRVLRTFPLYFIIVIGAGVFYLVAQKSQLHISFRNYWSFFFFLQNYFGYGTIFILTNLWAMAVTEQLYFAWGLLCKWTQPHTISWILPLALLAEIGVLLLKATVYFHYTNTLNYVAVYLLGAFCGSLHVTMGPMYGVLKKLTVAESVLLFSVGVGLVSFAFMFVFTNYLLKVFVLTFGFCIVILCLCHTKMVGKRVFTNKPVRYLGKISYGLYVFHAVVLAVIGKFLAFNNLSLAPISVFVISLLFTTFVASISYEYFETKFIALKKSFT